MRTYKAAIAWLAGLAMLAHVIAAGFCPSAASHRSGATVYDAVLGWVTLCTDGSAAGDSGTGGAGDDHAGHSGLCAALCAAVVTTVAAAISVLLAVLVRHSAAVGLRAFEAPHLRKANFCGGIGSRAPPLMI